MTDSPSNKPKPQRGGQTAWIEESREERSYELPEAVLQLSASAANAIRRGAIKVEDILASILLENGAEIVAEYRDGYVLRLYKGALMFSFWIPWPQKKKAKRQTVVEIPPGFSHFTAISDDGSARITLTSVMRRAPRDASARFTQGGLASSDAARAKKTVKVKSKKGAK